MHLLVYITKYYVYHYVILIMQLFKYDFELFAIMLLLKYNILKELFYKNKAN